MTLFRLFRSKETMVDEAIREVAHEVHPPQGLPANPRLLRPELVEWSTGQHGKMKEFAPLIRTCLAEVGERPELAAAVCDGSVVALADAVRYFRQARELGLIGREGSVEAAAVMLMNAVFMDAVTRDVVEGCRTVPESEAIGEFVDLTLRALGAKEIR